MNYHTFRKIEEEKQIDLVFWYGVLLVECQRFNLTLRLFQLDAFYVEIYCLETTGEIVSIHSFEGTSGLETYLKEIDISELIPLCS